MADSLKQVNTSLALTQPDIFKYQQFRTEHYSKPWIFPNLNNRYTCLFRGRISELCIETDSETKQADIQLKLIVNDMEQEAVVKKEIGKQVTVLSLTSPLHINKGDYIWISTDFADQIV